MATRSCIERPFSMTGYLFGDDLDPASRFEPVAQRPLLYETACAAVGVDPFDRTGLDCRFMQPALVALLLAEWEAIQDGSPSTLLVGEGVGEIAALAAAGAISSCDAIWLAALRGRLMSRVANALNLASLALQDVATLSARQLALTHELQIARDSAPGQVVLTGRRGFVDGARRTARKLGLDAVELPTCRVFPSAHFAAVRREWRTALDAAQLRAPRRAVLSCAMVGQVVHPRSSLGESLTAAIRVRQSRTALGRLGMRQLEVLPTAPI